jgi:acyl-[acyl-carrier-protein]-phospholipid O-acyltransferase / long-chain-fatty-acid--[acyl-carrier-protein] ligase
MLLHHMVIERAKKLKDKPAIIDKALDKTVSYSRLLIASLLLAKRFKKYKGNFLGVMLPNTAGCSIAVIATLMSGKIPVMINYSSGAEGNMRYAQKKCSFKTVITSKKLIEKIECPEVEGMVFLEDIMESLSGLEKIKAALQSKLPTKFIQNSVAGGDINDDAVILFTSGSEKDPKAVELTHKNIGSNVTASAQAMQINDDDIFLSILPLFHVFGQTATFWLPLYCGVTAVTYPSPLEYKTVVDIIREEQTTLLVGTPVFYMGYLRQAKPGDFKSARLAVAGADKVPDWLREKFIKDHDIVLYEGYGATETSPVVSLNTPDFCRPGSIGKPIPGVQVKIIDINSGKELGPDQEGKIMVKGDLIMKGYYGDIEETSLRLVDGWYETGDMGLMDEDGYLWHRGRLKRFVKVGGEMVSLVMVEYYLEKILGDSNDCCVVEIPDPKKGSRIIAVLTEKIAYKEMVNQLREFLPPIAMPKEVIFMEDLPKMPSGKVDFRTTTEMVIEQVN